MKRTHLRLSASVPRRDENAHTQHNQFNQEITPLDSGSSSANGSGLRAASRPQCWFFRRGNCRYGEQCRFSHDYVPPRTTENKATNTTRPVSSPNNSNNNAEVGAGAAAVVLNGTGRGAGASSANCSSSVGKKSSHNALVQAKEDWVNAPEFVPSGSQIRHKSYAEAVSPTSGSGGDDDPKMMELCPYAEMHGVCSYRDGECHFLHGDLCDLCGMAALHPYNHEKRREHTQRCVEQHERDMELSFAVARSKEKSCGVCFEVIMEKASGEQRFGILPNCNHCFCLSCIRKWRQARQFDNKIIRACPECRVTSDFVCPSMYWVDTKEEKEKLITDYKCALSRKDCKYFKQGRGKCPFGNKCFYLHALPDGTKRDVGPPPRQPRRPVMDPAELDVLQDSEGSEFEYDSNILADIYEMGYERVYEDENDLFEPEASTPGILRTFNVFDTHFSYGSIRLGSYSDSDSD